MRVIEPRHPLSAAAPAVMRGRFRAVCAAAAAVGALLAAPAWGGDAGVVACGARDALAATLEERFGETFTGHSRAAPEGVVELFVSRSGSWTIVLTKPNGEACPMAVGADAERDFGRRDLLGRPA